MMAGSMVYRTRAGANDDPKTVSFRQAMTAIQARLDNKSFNNIAGFHGAPGWYCWHSQINWRTPMRAQLFLPWHRAYLWFLEQALQDQVADVALPWWDWTRDNGIPAAYDSERVDGADNPLYKYRMRIQATARNQEIDRDTRRDISDPSDLPTEKEINELIEDETDWGSFSDRLQSYHNGVHVWVGGDMGDTTTAGYDPIFFAHHCMIDRIWYLWQVRHATDGIPQGLLDLPLQPFGKTVRDVINVQALGYEYAAATTPAIV